MRELARATGFDYPESQEDMEKWRLEWREAIMERSSQKKLRDRFGYDEESGGDPNSTSPDGNAPPSSQESAQHDALQKRKTGVQPVPMGRSWMWMGPYDWSYCERTELPKPPRSHYDHVTKSLVLNMDHYCPWMFNVVGYFNYRYFMNFLIYVAIGMTYGAVITFQPFMMVHSHEYHEQIIKSREIYQDTMHIQVDNLGKTTSFHYSQVKHLIPNVPVPREATPIAFMFIMCVAVGASVAILLGFHMYLIATAQTTIDFHGNRMKKERCKDRGEVFCNPYDMGLKRNVEQIWGSWGGDGFLRFWTVLLPSWRDNEFLPVPFQGDAGRRIRWKEDIIDAAADEEFANLV